MLFKYAINGWIFLREGLIYFCDWWLMLLACSGYRVIDDFLCYDAVVAI